MVTVLSQDRRRRRRPRPGCRGWAAPVRPVVPDRRRRGAHGHLRLAGQQHPDLGPRVVGTTIYAAGTFTEVVDAGGSWPRIDQPFLAAFDTRTGQWVDDWRPRVNRPAFALDVLPSGAIVVGGEFTQANGAVAEGIVRRPGQPTVVVAAGLISPRSR